MTHLLLLLHAGDYRDASRRRQDGLPDRYRHHSYALASLESLRSVGCLVTVVQMYSEFPYDEPGPADIRFVGLGGGPPTLIAQRVQDFIRDEDVTHAMLRSPSLEVLEVIAKSSARASVVLADSFPSPWRHRQRYRSLGKLLQHPGVDFVSNHHLNSSRQAVDVLRLAPSKVVPWDWPLDLLEVARTSAKGPPKGPLRLCYAGTVDKSKGVWDLVEAVGVMRDRGEDASLDLAGAGHLEEFWARVDRRGLREHVTHRGRIGGNEILSMMQESAFVCVPSRHAYPEGLPLTLFEAMASGSPILASDHPMFAGVVRHGETGFVFKAGSPRAIASAALSAWREPGAYELVSRLASEAYPDLGLNTLWGDIVRVWVGGGPSATSWLRERSLAGRAPGVTP